MVISVVQVDIDIFSLKVKKSVVSIVPATSRGFLVLKHALKAIHALY